MTTENSHASSPTVSTSLWTSNLDGLTPDNLVNAMCHSFSQFPFMRYNNLVMQAAATGDDEMRDEDVVCVVEMNQNLVGNVLYGILHGGVTATMLDSIGGIKVMIELMRKELSQQSVDLQKVKEKIGKVATTDLRVDYISAGRGSRFTASAEIIRLGSRQAVCRMELVNETGKIIAIGTASYVY